MKKLMILVVLVMSVIAMRAQAKLVGPDYGSTIVSPGVTVQAYMCFPQVMFDSSAAVYHFYATHPSHGTFSLDLRGKLQSALTVADLGAVTANIKQDGASTINKTVNCVDKGVSTIQCTLQYTSENIPTKVRLLSELGCGYTASIGLDYGTPEDTVYGSAGDDDGDGVENSDDNCPSTPFGTDVDGHGCEIATAIISDADGDGIEDSLDDCDGTEMGATVDANGCSDAQLVALTPEGDEGGLPDASDGGGIQTPAVPSYTPSGMSGETGGCSLVVH